jgi:hypothetical protein
MLNKRNKTLPKIYDVGAIGSTGIGVIIVTGSSGSMFIHNLRPTIEQYIDVLCIKIT